MVPSSPRPSSWPPSARSNLRRAVLGAVLLASACGAKREPIGRGDAGPSVVMSDGRADLGALPAVAEVEPNDTQPQSLGTERVRGSFMLGAKPDLDLYRIEVPASTAAPDGGAGFASDIIVRAGACNLLLEVLGNDGKPTLSRPGPAQHAAQLTHLAVDSGVTLRVREAVKKGQAAVGCDYTIEATTHLAAAGEEREPNDDYGHANSLTDAVVGTLDPFDRDLYTLPAAPAGSTFEVELAAIPELAPEIRLRRGDEVLLSARTGKGGELRMRNLPSGPGLLLQVRVLEGASELPYALKLGVEAPLDANTVEHEPNDDRAHATHVALATASMDLAGYLWPGDLDFYCTDVGLGARVDAMADVDFGLETFDAAGNSLAKVNAGKRGSAETVPFAAAARCVKVSAIGRATAFDAPYRLTISSQP